MSNVRYIQQDRAWRLRRRRDIPYYSAKKDAWCFNDEIDVSLERLIQKFVNYQLKFRYRYNDEIITRSTFTEVLEDISTRYEKMRIDGFEEDYNQQQIEWLDRIKQKLLAGAKMPPYNKHDKDTTIEDICEDFALYNECYDYLVYKNQPVEDSWHDHRFAHVLARLIEMPEYFTVVGFENQYSHQQLELIQAVKDKLGKREADNALF